MKILASAVLAFYLFSNIAYGDTNCDWSQIKKNSDNTYTYSAQLNLCVGNLVQQAAIKDKQIQDLTTALDLKNAALVVADQRTALWEKTSDDELQRLNSMEADQKHNDTLYFGLGVATTFLAAYAAAELIRH